MTSVKVGKLKAKTEEYAQSITIHGFTRILTAGKYESSVWLLLLLGSTCLISYVIHNRVMNYQAKGVYMDVLKETVQRHYFPAITICRNRVNKFRYCEGHRMYPLDDPATLVRPCFFLKIIFPIYTNAISAVKNWHSYFMSVSCFVGYKCKSLALSLLSQDGNCVTWNKDDKSYIDDGYNELQITPNVSRLERGNLEIIIHDPYTFGQVQENTMLISGGYNYELMLDKTVIKRKKYPFKSNCTDQKHPDVFPGNYTRWGCLTSMKCIQGLKKCGDTFDICKPFMDVYKEYFNKTLPERTVRDCLRTEWEKLYFEDCPPPCTETQYEVSASIVRNIGASTKNGITLRRRYQQPHSYYIVEEKEVYSLINLLCESGGFLGLLMGASVLSIVELVILLVLKIFSRKR